MPLSVMAVCRLDGPTEATVRRIIDDSLFAEEHGLKGKAYFDARWPYPSANETSHYRLYDKAIHNTARIVKKTGRMPVVLDEREALLAPMRRRTPRFTAAGTALGNISTPSPGQGGRSPTTWRARNALP